MYVCHCRAVTSGTIRALAERGVRTAREVTEQTGAGSVCGRCQGTISRILRSLDPHPGSSENTSEGDP